VRYEEGVSNGGKQASSKHTMIAAAQRDRRQPGHLATVNTGHVEQHSNSLKALDIRIIGGGGGGGRRASDRSAALRLELATLVEAHGGKHSEAGVGQLVRQHCTTQSSSKKLTYYRIVKVLKTKHG
jgi:hypothetical protein